jgi:hypothetical protein
VEEEKSAKKTTATGRKPLTVARDCEKLPGDQLRQRLLHHFSLIFFQGSAMFYFTRLHVGWISLAAVALTLSGCGDAVNKKGVTITGTVTYDGQPVPKGYIQFLPEDGKGNNAGVEIHDGKFKAQNVTPGKNRIQISSTATDSGPKGPPDMAAMMRQQEQRKRAGMDQGKQAATDYGAGQVPSDAVGNNEVQEIPNENVELTFELKPPKQK